MLSLEIFLCYNWQVRKIIEHLWENEARLCAFFCNIQGQHLNTPSKVAGPSMFFLDSILVPPIRFRPPAKGGDSVSILNTFPKFLKFVSMFFVVWQRIMYCKKLCSSNLLYHEQILEKDIHIRSLSRGYLNLSPLSLSRT